MSPALVIVIFLLLALPGWLLLRLGRPAPAEPLPEPPEVEDHPATSAAHDLYVRGEGERLLEVLEDLPLGEYVTLSTALGRYAQALAAVEADAPEVLDPAHEPANWHEWLLRINVAETLSELARSDAALALVSTQAPDAFLETGRRVTAAWLLGEQGRGEEALALLRDIAPGHLGSDYVAEAHLTRARLELSLGRLDASASALLDARATTARASTKRNLLTVEAELAWRRQDGASALRLFERAAAHHWRWQGGEGLLRHGLLLRELGREAEARTVWERCASQDPESLAARRAEALLAA